MVFKDLIRFNEAMLAKQIWRLQTDKNSLLYKVFSTKYFPTGLVFEEKARRDHLLGRVYLKQDMSLKKGCYGELVMGHKFGYSMTIGFLGVFQQRQYHSRKLLEMTLVFVHSLIRQQRTGMSK